MGRTSGQECARTRVAPARARISRLAHLAGVARNGENKYELDVHALDAETPLKVGRCAGVLFAERGTEQVPTRREALPPAS